MVLPEVIYCWYQCKELPFSRSPAAGCRLWDLLSGQQKALIATF